MSNLVKKITMPVNIDEIEQLDTDEKIKLAEKLWKSIESDRSHPLTDAQKKLLEKRLDEHKLNPSSGKTWTSVKSKYSA